MRVFISSVVVGLEDFREAAAQAARALGHEVRRSEDFAASADSPQQACLAGVRWSEVVVLLLGERYGSEQASGLSATHEEYREAKASRSVLPFIRAGIDPEPRQKEFMDEVRDWAAGHITRDFSTPGDLRDAVVRALHEQEMAQVAGQVSEEEVLARLKSHLATRPTAPSGPRLILSVIGVPPQQIVRPADLEVEALSTGILREALFGEQPIFDVSESTDTRVSGNALILRQPSTEVILDETGAVLVDQRAAQKSDPLGHSVPALIEETIRERIRAALRFAGWLLDTVDSTHRLAHVALGARLDSAGYLNWRTLAEQRASPNQMQVSVAALSPVVVHLAPPTRPRAALLRDTEQTAEDLLVLLRRQLRS